MNTVIVAKRRLTVASGQRGFTLLEILIVIVIVGTLVGAASLIMTDHAARRAQQDADRLQHTLSFLREKAVLDNRQYALQFFGDSYRVLRLADVRHWIDAPNWERHTLHDNVRLRVNISGVNLPLAEAFRADQPRVPHLMILSSDESEAFDIEVLADGRRIGSVVSDGISLAQFDAADGAAP